MTPERWRLLERIFHSAVSLPPNERQEYLNQECGADAELRKEIELLLTKDDPPDDSVAAMIGREAAVFSGKQESDLSGSSIGPYTILRKIGSGGMGTVYLAEDTRLRRSVALKLLPESFSRDPDRIRRFQLEARAASAINHPNIITIHGVEEINSLYLIVSEYVEGQTLAEKMNGKHLSQNEVLELGIQMAEGLAEAHRLGVIHRDIKPRNIMITNRGIVKILDFGLAKVFEADGRKLGSGSGNTASGMIMGTVEYMSPEQANGKKVDHRSDLFSLGVLLFEMSSGQLPFPADTMLGVMYRIIHTEPDPITRFGKDLPWELERILRKCLEKDPDRRYQSAQEIAIDLKNLKRAVDTGERILLASANPKAEEPNARLRSFLIASTLILTLAAAAAAVYLLSNPRHQKQLRLSILPPEKSDFVGSMSLSPDGGRVAFVAMAPDHVASLWIRSLDSAAPQKMEHTEGASDPFWSPDGRYIAFFADGKMKKIKADGGLAEDICDALDARGGTWGNQQIILFTPGGNDVIYSVSPDGGNVVPVTKLDPSKKEESHRWPFFLPDGRHFVYMSRGLTTLLNVSDLNSGNSTPLTQADSIGMIAGGYLLFLRGQTLMAQRLNARNLSLEGQAVPVAPDVWASTDIYGLSSFSISENGVLIYRPGGAEATEFHFYDRAGRDLGSVGTSGWHMEPFFSPDEKRVVFRRNHDLWILDLADKNYSRITFDPADEVTMVWSPDGNQLVFGSNRSGPYDLFLKPVSGDAEEQLLFHSSQTKFPDDWSGDGKWIVFESVDPQTKFDLWTIPMTGDRKPIVFEKTPYNELHAQFSPDNRWMAYVSDETGKTEIYVRPFPEGKGGKWQISSGGGDQPFWNKDGKELFYLSPDNKIISVQIKGLPDRFEPGAVTPLFPVRIAPPGIPGSRGNYLPASNGQKFLVNTLVSDPSSAVINVILNWNADLGK